MTRTTAGEPRDLGPARRPSPVEREPVTPSPPTVSVPDWLYRRDRTIDGSQSGRYSPPPRQGRFRPIAKPNPSKIPPARIRPRMSYRGWTYPLSVRRLQRNMAQRDTKPPLVLGVLVQRHNRKRQRCFNR